MIYCNSAACPMRGFCASHITNVPPGCYDVTPFSDEVCDGFETALCPVCKKREIYVKGLCHYCYNKRDKEFIPFEKPKKLKEQIIKMYKEGAKQVAIAKELKITKQWVSLVLKEWKSQAGIKWTFRT